jgi:type III pantothenate kinase
MLLTIDAGNSEVTVGLFTGPELLARWRLSTATERTPDEWSVALESFVIRSGRAPGEIRAACIASVVPHVTAAMTDGVRNAITTNVGVVDPRAALPLTLDVDDPLSVGADRIANCLGALALYPGDSIVIGFGTATTFNCVSADGRFFGGSIMPGLRTSADYLVRRAAKLSATELRAPDRAIGRNTDDNVRGGVLFGAADAASGMIDRMRREWPGAAMPRTIATGGLATLVGPLVPAIDVVDPDVTLHGVRVAAGALQLLG